MSEEEEEVYDDEDVLASNHSDDNSDIKVQLNIVDATEYQDHFSLRTPSSSVRFRGAKVMVYDQANDQILLEDRALGNKHTITVKRMRSGSFGLRFLRTGYTLVSLLLVGFLFVFCFQIVLFLFLDIPLSGGATTRARLDVFKLIGTMLSIPLFLHAMGSIMALGTAFCADTWNGHPLFRSMMDWPIVAVEWVCFVLFLGIPILTMVITLFMKHERWWEVSALVWMISVFVFFVFFCFMVLLLEVTACIDLVKIATTTTTTATTAANNNRKLPWYKLAQQAILWTQTQHFAGTRDERYLVEANDDPQQGCYALCEEHTPLQVKQSLYSRLTVRLGFIFDTLPQPVRRYSVEEMRDIVPFVTNHNWSLEKMYCRNSNARVLYAVQGGNALEPAQITSTVVCTTMGLGLASLGIVGFFVWIGQSTLVISAVAAILLLCCIVPIMRSLLDLMRTYANLHQAKQKSVAIEEEEDGDTTVYQVWETVTISKPKAWYCWTRVVLDIAFLFLWPLVTLYNSPRLGTLFLILGVFSFLRVYFDASWVLSELGSVNDVDLNATTETTMKSDEKGDEEVPATTSKWTSIRARVGLLSAHHYSSQATRQLLKKARTSEVIGKISRARSVRRWMWFYGIFALVACFMMIQAAGSDVTIPEGGRPPIVQLQDFYYEPQPDLPYPTCEMTKGFKIPGVGSSSLPDYSFLAALSYETPNVTQYHLDKYFGSPGAVVDEAEFVSQYRIDSQTVDNPVYFKLFAFPSIPGYGIVSIRGSQTTADFLVDAQLWSSAFLAQVVRAFIPFGWIWTPILDDLVTVVNFVESAALKRVAYYQVTTDFVNAVLEQNYTHGGKSFHTLRLTGASLGGGLAIISGAQTRANAVAISGLNGQLSRHTFLPPLTNEQLNTRVLNVIPDRDLIARVGDRNRLFQEIDCKAPKNSLLGCHSMWRSVCELAYTCGTHSGDRPVLCRCVQKFGYPEPIQNGTRTFEQACAEEEQVLKEELSE